VVLRAALEADCLTRAIRAVASSPRSASVNILLGQSGEVLDLEAVPGDLGYLNPVGGVLTHANHFESRVPVRDLFADRGGSSYFRAARAARLLPEGRIDEADLAAVLADHASYPHAICRHADPRDADEDRSESLYSVIMDLEERRLSVAAGPPCDRTYAAVHLDKLV
jgi:isopenicillin-N N-acyltransferase-like protein